MTRIASVMTRKILSERSTNRARKTIFVTLAILFYLDNFTILLSNFIEQNFPTIAFSSFILIFSRQSLNYRDEILNEIDTNKLSIKEQELVSRYLK